MLEGLLLTERETASDWCEGHLIFPRGTSANAPGPLSFARQPWAREILNCCQDQTIETVYVCGGSQIGKTALLIATLGYFIGQQPSNGVWAMTSIEQVRDFSKKRVMEFIKGNACLARYLRAGDSSAFQPLNYQLTHMDVKFTGAGSPSNLASVSAAWVIGDEAAKWPHIDKNEAPPLQLIQERTKGFPRRFHLFCSTPTTIENEFWQGFASTDMRQFFMPCPYCGGSVAFMFAPGNMKWDKPTDGHMDIDLAAATVRYVCPHCSGEIYEDQKPAMMQAGCWAPSDLLRKEFASENIRQSSRSRGYHLDTLYSPFVSWGQCVRAFLDCYTRLTAAIDLQNFRNSWCALPYERTAMSIKAEHISKLCGDYSRGTVPGTPYYISVGYDPGGNQTHWVACAVYDSGEMRVIDWGTILMFRTESHLENDGTDADPAWRSHVDRPGIAPHFASLEWGGHRPSVAFVDAGYSTADIYLECSSMPGVLTPTKGASTKIGTWYVRPAGDSWPGLQVLSYSDHNAKMSLYAETINKGNAPRLLLPREEDCDIDLFKGLSGQKLVVKNRSEEWRKVPEDHYGDCIKIQRVGWWSLASRFEEAPMYMAADPENAPMVQAEGQ